MDTRICSAAYCYGLLSVEWVEVPVQNHMFVKRVCLRWLLYPYCECINSNLKPAAHNSYVGAD